LSRPKRSRNEAVEPYEGEGGGGEVEGEGVGEGEGGGGGGEEEASRILANLFKSQ
jgi:hypothetical protein